MGNDFVSPFRPDHQSYYPLGYKTQQLCRAGAFCAQLKCVIIAFGTSIRGLQSFARRYKTTWRSYSFLVYFISLMLALYIYVSVGYILSIFRGTHSRLLGVILREYKYLFEFMSVYTDLFCYSLKVQSFECWMHDTNWRWGIEDVCKPISRIILQFHSKFCWDFLSVQKKKQWYH